MSTPASHSEKTRYLIEGALLVALAFILSFIKVYELPYGGSISLEMLPIVLLGLRNGPKWGALSGFTFSLLKLILGFSNVLYCNTLPAQIGCILLDYILAYTVLGLAALFAGLFGERRNYLGIIVGTVIAGLMQFLCSFLSGWLLWGSYAWEGYSAPAYSFVYNGSYMLPNIIICTLVIAILYKAAPKLFRKGEL